MVGSCLLISPVLENGKREVDAYFPKNNLWFDYVSGENIRNVGSFNKISAPLGK
jgi:alpha-glucosidase (family GH31 glycosyl hydrolase)